MAHAEAKPLGRATGAGAIMACALLPALSLLGFAERLGLMGDEVLRVVPAVVARWEDLIAIVFGRIEAGSLSRVAISGPEGDTVVLLLFMALPAAAAISRRWIAATPYGYAQRRTRALAYRYTVSSLMFFVVLAHVIVIAVFDPAGPARLPDVIADVVFGFAIIWGLFAFARGYLVAILIAVLLIVSLELIRFAPIVGELVIDIVTPGIEQARQCPEHLERAV